MDIKFVHLHIVTSLVTKVTLVKVTPNLSEDYNSGKIE